MSLFKDFDIKSLFFTQGQEILTCFIKYKVSMPGSVCIQLGAIVDLSYWLQLGSAACNRERTKPKTNKT